MKSVLIALALVFANMTVEAQNAPSVTGIQAIQHDGQTFITWTDAAPGIYGVNYRYDIYRSANGPITNTGSASLVQMSVYNNSAQLIGPKPYIQLTRLDSVLPTVKTQNGGTPLPVWSGVAVYTNLAAENAYYAVITHDLTGATADSQIVPGDNAMVVPVSESVGNVKPILQIPGTAALRMIGCSNCYVTSASIGQPLWLKLHPSGGIASPWGDDWVVLGQFEHGVSRWDAVNVLHLSRSHWH